MIYSILEFLADKWWIFLIFWSCLHHTYIYNGKYSYISIMFKFKMLEDVRNNFKPIKEPKYISDNIRNFYEYFTLCFWYFLIGGAGISLYIGLFGIVLKIILKLIEKGI